MEYSGQVKGGVVVFEDGAPPEGSVVRVKVVDEGKKAGQKPSGLWAKMMRYAGTVKGLPPDFAKNHDHYIHGAAKKS